MGMLFSWMQEFWSKEMEICILGLSNAGKSSFCHVLDTGEYDPDLLPTVGFALPKISKGGVTIKAWDLGGASQMRSLWSRYARSCNAIIYVIDPNDPSTLDLTIEELSRIINQQELAGIPLLILFNKMDLMNHLSVEEKNAKLTDILTQMHYSEITQQKGFIPISCKQLLNIDKALEWLVNIAENQSKAQ